MGKPIADWLDVTYSSDSDLSSVSDMAIELCSQVEFDTGARRGYRFGTGGADSGLLIVERSHNFQRVSASGAVLAFLRGLRLLDEFLGALSDSPHNVTRLDVAHDVPCRDPGRVVRRHYARTRDGVAFGRKGLQTKAIFSPGIDGLDTGTVYHGHRSSAKVTARVYDKGHQMMEMHGAVVPPHVRYELTFRREAQASLRDASNPESIFWAHAPSLGLKRPYGVLDWSPGAVGCAFPRRGALTPFQRLQRAVDALPLDDVTRLCPEVGPEGVACFLRMIEKRLRAASGTAGGQPCPGAVPDAPLLSAKPRL